MPFALLWLLKIGVDRMGLSQIEHSKSSCLSLTLIEDGIYIILLEKKFL
jgi:hypothetical protein